MDGIRDDGHEDAPKKSLCRTFWTIIARHATTTSIIIVSTGYRLGPSKVEEIWREDFLGMYEEGGDICYVLTMHPQIIGRHHRMQMLERVITLILERDNVWWAQMHEIADEFRGLS